MTCLTNTRFRVGPYELDVNTTCYRSYFHLLKKIWVSIGLPMCTISYPCPTHIVYGYGYPLPVGRKSL